MLSGVLHSIVIIPFRQLVMALAAISFDFATDKSLAIPRQPVTPSTPGDLVAAERFSSDLPAVPEPVGDQVGLIRTVCKARLAQSTVGHFSSILIFNSRI